MADVISTLFGITPQSVNNQLDTRAVDIGKLWGAATVNPYATPAVQNAYRDQQAAQFALGSMGARAVGGMFGLQDPMLKRATGLESILQSTQMELGEEANNPAVFYPELQKRLGESGFTREAMQVGQVAQKAIQEFGLNQAKVGTEQAQQRKLGIETASKAQETMLEQQLRQELTKLPADAAEEDYLAVVRKYAPAKDVMSAIERGQVAKENRLARSEDLQFRVEAQLQAARERNDTLIEQARLQGATAREIAAMRVQSAEQIAQMRSDTQRQLAEQKAADKAISNNAPKDVADAEASLAGINFTIEGVEEAKDLLANGKVKFGIKENTLAATRLRVGNPTQNDLNQLIVKRKIKEGVNQIQQAAKGTQTEGDARRAQELYLNAESANSTEAWQQALDALENTQKKLKIEKSTYIKSRGFGGTSNSDPLGIRK